MNNDEESLPPILVTHLLYKIDGMLIELLKSLEPDDWEVQTIASKWRVKDVVSHLLDTQLRRLSIARDGCSIESRRDTSPGELTAFINQLNDEGTRIYRRLSPRVLLALIGVASHQAAEYFESLDPFAPAIFAVSWAGEHESLNWFDTAREYTERWHHQQQIRLALNRPGIMTSELYYPVIDCFMRALPYGFERVPANEGTLVQFEIMGDCGGTWYLRRINDLWRLITLRSDVNYTSSVRIPQEIAWRLFTKGIDQSSALSQIQIDGDSFLAKHIMNIKGIVG